ncbi:hypothetical protein [Myxosarcina sp. GI1(2024)]
MRVSNKVSILLSMSISSIAVLGIGGTARAQSANINFIPISEHAAIADAYSFELPSNLPQFIVQTPELETEEVETEETEVEIDDTETDRLETEEVEIEETEVEIDDTETDEGVAGLGIVSPGGNYLGVGASLGLVEDIFGDFGAAAFISKFKLFSLNENNDVSFRPSVLVGKDVTFVVPVTLDVLLGDPDAKIVGKTFIPYGGLGFSFTTADDVFDFILTGGLDIPFERFTVNLETNVGVVNDFAWGLMLGIGYNF